MLFSFLYEGVLWILALISLPKLLYHLTFGGKYKENFLLRMGYHFPKISKNGKKLIWLHAVSVGETKALAPLATLIQNENPYAFIVVSSVTATGHAEAKRSIPFANVHVYLPFDFYRLTHSIIKRVSPDLVIISETDFWYNFLKACQLNHAKIVLVNGKISSKSEKRYKLFQWFSSHLFPLIDLYCVQNKEYANRFYRLGIPISKIKVTGNLKCDIPISILDEKSLNDWKKDLGLNENQQVIILASTHHPEELLLIDKIATLWSIFPELKILIAPRHPERFQEVYIQLLKQWKEKVKLYSQKTGFEKNGRIMIIDAMGLLGKAFQVSTIAIVGGSYVEHVGGHNILEPCAFSVPVIFGPYMHNQLELVNLVQHSGGGKKINLEEIPHVIKALLQDPIRRKKIGMAGYQLVQTIQGSSQRTLDEIKKINKANRKSE